MFIFSVARLISIENNYSACDDDSNTTSQKNYFGKLEFSLFRYLDDRPIFADERRLAEAFFYRGGIETEREERKLIRQEKEEERRRNMRNFDRMIRRAREEFREGRLMRSNDDRYPNPEDDPVDTIERRRER